MPAYIKKLKLIKPSNPRLTNDDLLPAKQTWNWYNIFAFWMSDVHSVGGYIFAGTLFALGLTSWQIFITLILGISIVMVMANLLAKPSQLAGVPYPVIARMSFGVYGANIPALLRGIIAIVWYGIQTYLASIALTIILLKFFPSLIAWNETAFLGLPYLGWISFFIMWSMQTLLFLMKMEAIKVFLDYSGPAVYIVMFLLMIWIVYHAGWENISFSLSTEQLNFWQTIGAMLVGMSLIVNYFAGPTLNFGDFSRFCRSMKDVKVGNFWGLPVNFTAFALTAIITITGTPVIFGQMIMDPLGIVAKIDNIGIVLLLSFTFVTATVGTNIVANFVSAANDISNLYPGRISWRFGGMIAAVLSVIILPWNLYNSPQVIHHTIDLLAGTLGPMYGIILIDYYRLRKRVIQVDDLFDDTPEGVYWYQNGYNRAAIKALVPASALSIAIVLLSDMNVDNAFFKVIDHLAPFSLVISMVVGGLLYYRFAKGNIKI
ncbi:MULTISPECIES: NCS1 family nucleobase:cation symporter-1 [unclassified Neisseria]|uniref:NCS1 family nucleobase:cation symporter-1 n=1 Tax=unclassified Neisseria TaxID=2623750 RepID=UPI002665344C|nr:MULTISPECIES: NCS1 family nucleobase:cation symporter-1 [unclassified Neisseria]MDO1509274.1 NCS1 family nucleobase:cation symporter-1 [Neisseria sp. MVDL19-042950]MDO1515447.1 NCS1 family nucleobase:cation symporter-1 [Neisseria sp. MVDL18-041461]MDO1562807.1 NCS1 family nucleobase:cation symporter-1 [Neisseria sp. MVDL20-010259]